MNTPTRQQNKENSQTHNHKTMFLIITQLTGYKKASLLPSLTLFRHLIILEVLSLLPSTSGPPFFSFCSFNCSPLLLLTVSELLARLAALEHLIKQITHFCTIFPLIQWGFLRSLILLFLNTLTQ